MGKLPKAIRAMALVTGLLVGVSTASSAPEASLHAPCTDIDLWQDLQSVIDSCDRLIKSEKLSGDDLAEALRHQGNAYFRSFEVDLAIKNYQRALELKPDWAAALTNFGNAASTLGNYDLAMQLLRRAVELEPDYSPAHAALANILSNSGDKAGSIAEYDRAIVLDPEDYLARFNRALTKLQLGHRLEALHEFDALLLEDETKLNRTYVHWQPEPDKDLVGEIQMWRSRLFVQVGSFDEALAALQSAIERKPGYAAAVVARSTWIRSVPGYEHLYQEALAAVDRALELHPETPRLLIEKGSLLKKMSEDEEALAILADSARFDESGDGEFFLERSYLWERFKEFERAEADMAAAMRADGKLFRHKVVLMQKAGYLMSWSGLDPNVALSNAMAACVRDPFC